MLLCLFSILVQIVIVCKLLWLCDAVAVVVCDVFIVDQFAMKRTPRMQCITFAGNYIIIIERFLSLLFFRFILVLVARIFIFLFYRASEGEEQTNK